MHPAIKAMLTAYQCQSVSETQQALHEIIQNIALLALWRAKFFEHAAFYGGTALRLLHGLDRFSEDLDFSLLKPHAAFDLSPYNKAVASELMSYGLHATVSQKNKPQASAIQSAFIKCNIKENFIQIEMLDLGFQVHRRKLIKIKMEVDTDPPPDFSTIAHFITQPVPFSVLGYALPDLFAGKMHALLCRAWKQRIKGRDWYDFIWYIQNKIPLNIQHLKSRLVQSGHWNASMVLDESSLRTLFEERIAVVDFNIAQEDVRPFIQNVQALSVWSGAFFNQLARQLIIL